ncbi:MAG: excinuclease ABC subunit UvrA [Clostridiales bacterium]|nr:excinuclease ABC subunit UvrA [Clostridia bacterium]PWL99170.1 MAG: excinuclease ABC subunit UvrA [Clostridiales bacterium]PWM02135.1 MAG: excinuclease ABC subunit UvrA [Clostridiales bacterium]
MKEEIVVKGAKENNLKNINVKIPRNTLTVFTGLSGSGKSTLAFDTIFAEGQRRYVESLSSYARQFLGQMEKPDVESIEGLSPAISIDQKTTSHNPRSTVGTVTEIYDYFRLLFARVGVPHCPKCGREIRRQTVDEIADRVMAMPEGSKILVSAPVVRGRKGEYVKELASYKKSGYGRVKIDGIVYDLQEEIKLEKNLKHNISVVVDRLVVKAGIQKRLTDSLETALKLANGLVVIDDAGEGKEELYSVNYACPDCGISFEEIEPRLFSFNTPYGACPECLGLGFRQTVDADLICPDKTKTLREGAIRVSGWNLDSSTQTQMYLNALSKHYGFSMDVPVKDLPADIYRMLMYGNGGEKIDLSYQTRSFSGSYKTSWEGFVVNLQRRYSQTSSDGVKYDIERYMRTAPCTVCGGKRLKKEALSVYLGGKNIWDLCEMSVDKLYEFVDNLSLTETEHMIADAIVKEIKNRIGFLRNVGLNYLTLARTANTLSGGESQRIRLATQIGSALTGVLYILDEPSIGLHQRDNEKLLHSLKGLRDLGNTLIVVEHDEDTIEAADYIVDIGPKAGVHGGEVVACGTQEDVMAEPRSITGDYLAGRRKIDVPEVRSTPDGRWLTVYGCRQNNLKNIDIRIPVGLITAVTGVSGSGKSSFVNEIVYPFLANRLNGARQPLGDFDRIEGVEYFDKVIAIDQSPIGRTPRSNPATYTGVFNSIRDLFAMTPDAQERGYKAGRFSFNVSGGRCEHCFGDGIIKIEMHFLPDIFVPCEVCGGKRYNRETLEVKYKGKSISDVLEMTVEEACEFFQPVPSIYNKMKTLNEVGLGYIKLGQSATTLSGGEAQRVKLATELSRRSTGKTFYILDEPTTGLHTYDVDKLIKILLRLRAGGNTVLVIEHNLDVIKTADYIVDLGPEGGSGGGTVVCTGSPEEVARVENSYTGQFLKKLLEKKRVENSGIKTR